MQNPKLEARPEVKLVKDQAFVFRKCFLATFLIRILSLCVANITPETSAEHTNFNVGYSVRKHKMLLTTCADILASQPVRHVFCPSVICKIGTVTRPSSSLQCRYVVGVDDDLDQRPLAFCRHAPTVVHFF